MRGRLFAGRRTERLIEKDGSCSVVSKNVSYSQNSFYRDIFTSLLDMRWRYNMVVFVFVFVGSWFFFAMLWWMVAFFHGDLPNDKVTTQRSTNDGMINVPCVDGVNNFLTALLFSVETQQTVGYGTRNLNSHCTSATILLVVQACMGILLQSLMTGVVYSKLSRPKHRARTMMFSKFAVICQRDDQYCLLFRVGDTRKSYLIGTSIRVLLIKSKDECSFFSNFQHSLDLEMDQDAHDSSILLIWPVTVVHKIDENSPLWNVSVEDLFTAKFEIVVVLQGTIEHTGMTAQLCTSYLPSEILWGHRLAPLLTYQNENGKYEIEFSEFHKVIPDKNMPECSARDRGKEVFLSKLKWSILPRMILCMYKYCV
ncbi:hypothetical protein HELRODRAFT_157415 [Helobdella robusta]|uniref:Inward rectifier potassium channel C-terminal domain-containing protein n=1 Tax=Helobdella robusta TaxID=6412 RepID=T1EMB1_HELRO|nr:hypothetical protein HELRODRAFT_157415 [Helobdella robusta]ESO00025.1 hypothetical protein HELRODRAFT_157415 [Helobdella robusta]